MTDEDEILQTLYSPDRGRRVHIFRRRNGTFGYEEEFLDIDEYGNSWIPLSSQLTIFDSAETALREAGGRIAWLGGTLCEE